MQPQRADRSTGTVIIYSLVLACAVAVLYWHALAYPPIFDDVKLFRHGVLEGQAAKGFVFTTRGLYSATMWGTYLAFGENIVWFRVGNLVLHAAAVIALFLLLRSLLAAVAEGTSVRAVEMPAFCVAAMFAMHPVAVYGVAYLTERSTVMATLFSLLALLAFVSGLFKQSKWWLPAAVGFYVLALLSKEHSVMLPGVTLALALLFRDRARPRWKPILGTLLVTGACGISTIMLHAQVIGTAYEPYGEKLVGEVVGDDQGLDGHAHAISAMTQCLLFFRYLLLWLVPWPAWMSVDIRVPFATGLSDGVYVAAVAGFVAYAALAIWLLFKGGRRGLLGLGLLFPWLMFATELSTIRIQEPFVLYRSYLWMSGGAIVAAVVLSRLKLRHAWLFLSGAYLLPGVAAWNRIDTFSSELKLWNDAARLNEGKDALSGSDRIYHNRGAAYTALGRYDDALRDFDRVINIAPPLDANYYERGWGHLRLGHAREAYSDFSEVIRLKPQFADAYVDRAMTLIMLSRFREARTDAEYALKLEPGHARGLQVLAEVYLRMSEAMNAENKTAEAELFQTKHLQLLAESCRLGFDHACELLRTRARP